MDLFLSWDVIWGKNDPKVAAMHDDAEHLRRQSQQVEQARRIWEGYFLRAMGSAIAFDGAAGRGQVPAEAIKDLESVRRQIETSLEHADLAVGIGLKISEADLSLKLALKRGGTVIFYTDDVPKALEEKDEDPLGKGERRKLVIDDQSTSPDHTFPPQTVSATSLSPLLEQVKKTNVERRERIAHLVKTTTGSTWTNKFGDGVVVGMDPHNREQWRTTVIATDGHPKYHFVSKDHAKALELAGSSLGVNLHGEPHSFLKPLAKADGPEGPPGPKGPAPQKVAENSVAAGGGFTGATQPGGAADAAPPAGEASEHSQGEAMANVAEDAPGPIETTHAGVDFQEQMQAAADDSDNQDAQMAGQTQQGQRAADLKTTVVQVLQQIRQQAPVIEQLKALEPGVYQAITAVTQVMVAMAKELMGIAPVKKAEAETDPVLEDLFFMKKVDGGYLGRDGNVYSPDEALALSKGEKIEQAPHEAPPPDGKLIKLEYFRAKDGIRIPVHGSRERKDWNKRMVEKIKETWGYLGEMRGRTLDIGQLDTMGSGNPVRNHDRYKLYRRMLASGDKLPPIVVRRNGLKYDILDGSHRVKAAQDHGFTGQLDAIEVGGGFAKMDDMPAVPDVVKAASDGECIHFYGKGDKCLRCKKTKVEKTDLMPGGKGDDRSDSDFDAEQLAHGVRTEMEEHGLDAARAKEIAKDHLAENPQYYRMEKAKLPLPENAPKHTHREWPVGTVKDSSPGGTREVGKVKVQHPENGKTSWVEVRAGQVLSNDGHAISSRNPGGK